MGAHSVIHLRPDGWCRPRGRHHCLRARSRDALSTTTRSCLLLHLRAVAAERWIQYTALDVTPDLSGDRFCSGNRHQIIPAAQPIDPPVFSIDPHPDHDAAIVHPQRWLCPQDPAPAQQSGLSVPPPEAKPKPHLHPPKPPWLARLLAHSASADLKPPVPREISRLSITSSL